MMDILGILSGIRPEFDFQCSKDFFADGLLDSLDLIALVADLEKTYGTRIDGLDIVPENFCSIEAIASFLRRNGVSL